MNDQTQQTTNEPQQKVKLFTHTDMDGCGCAVLAKVAFGDNVDISYCNYNYINNEVSDFIESVKQDPTTPYNKIYITDISVSPEVADKLEELSKTSSIQVRLIDHHKTALHLNSYSFATVSVEDDNANLHSGTSLFYSELFYYVFPFSSTYQFSEIVRKYDSWEWNTKYNDIIPKQFNDLFGILGKERFINLILSKIDNYDMTLTKDEQFLLELRQEEINHYIEFKNKILIKRNLHNYNIGIVFSDRFTSELGNELCNLNPDIDLVAMINPSHSVSYRTNKPNIDVSEFAKIYGGGGHKAASGHTLDDDTRNKIIELIF